MRKQIADAGVMSVFEFKQKYFPRALKEDAASRSVRPAFLDAVHPKNGRKTKRAPKRTEASK